MDKKYGINYIYESVRVSSWSRVGEHALEYAKYTGWSYSDMKTYYFFLFVGTFSIPHGFIRVNVL